MYFPPKISPNLSLPKSGTMLPPLKMKRGQVNSKISPPSLPKRGTTLPPLKKGD